MGPPVVFLLFLMASSTATNDKQQEIGREGLYFLDSSFFSFNFLACRLSSVRHTVSVQRTHVSDTWCDTVWQKDERLVAVPPQRFPHFLVTSSRLVLLSVFELLLFLGTRRLDVTTKSGHEHVAERPYLQLTFHHTTSFNNMWWQEKVRGR